MKPVFHPRLLNDYFGDPCVFIRLLYEKRAILFDLGTIDVLTPSEIYKISDVFVSHTHMDHFIGFDTLLRAVLRREAPLHIYGPSSILPCIEGKLRGYTWNLIEEYPTLIHVHAFDGRRVTDSVFSARNRFRKQTVSKTASDGLLLRDQMLEVRAIKLDHGIPCLAFSLQEEFHINIDRDLLLRKGLSVGPWLNDFKKVLRFDPKERPQKIRVGETCIRVSDLTNIARITRGQKISFVTDIAPTRKNLSLLPDFIKDSDIFFCEAYFLDEDHERAEERSHLTAKVAGALAKKAGVKRLELMHFSPKYMDCPERVIDEAMEEFLG